MQHSKRNSAPHIEIWEIDPQKRSVQTPNLRHNFGSTVHTLDQLATRDKVAESKSCSNVVIPGKSRDKRNYKKRAHSKFYTDNLTFKLLRYSEGLAEPENENEALIKTRLYKSFWNAFYCSKTLYQDGITLKAKYCGNKFCVQCSRMQTRKNIEGYLPEIQEFIDPQMLTVSDVNVSKDQLSKRISRLSKSFTKLVKSFNKYQERHGLPRLKAVRKIECTYNFFTKMYHPHIHIIIDGKFCALDLLKRWLSENPTANSKGQDITPFNKSKTLEQNIREIFKYFSPLSKKDKKTGKEKLYPIEAIYTIIKAFKGKRSLQAYGIKKVVDLDPSELKGQEVDFLKPDVIEWKYITEKANWFNLDTMEALTKNKPSKKHMKLFGIKKDKPPHDYADYLDETLVRLHKKKEVIKPRNPKIEKIRQLDLFNKN